jgi:hypothetical protein
VSTPPPPPGWYPDPWSYGSYRWWDGWQWTPHAAPAPMAGQFPTRDLRQLNLREQQLWNGARIAVVVWALYSTLQLIVAVVEGHWLAHAAPWSLVTHDIRTGQRLDVSNGTALGSGWSFLQLPLEVLAIIFLIRFLMWQYNAAGVARGLGYQASLSPGWGVGVWFIPIANLFMPYWALRDLLPPGHLARQKAVYAWLCYVGAIVCTLGTFVAVYLVGFAGVLLAVAGAACVLGGVLLGYQLLEAIRADHDAAAGGKRW